MTPIARQGAVTISGHLTPQIFSFIRACPGFTKWLDGNPRHPNGGVMFEASRFHVNLWRQMMPDLPIQDADGTLERLRVVPTPIAQHARLTTARE